MVIVPSLQHRGRQTALKSCSSPSPQKRECRQPRSRAKSQWPTCPSISNPATAPQLAQTATPGIEPPTFSSRAAVHNHWAKLVPARGRQNDFPKTLRKKSGTKCEPKARILIRCQGWRAAPFLGGGGVWEGTFTFYIF